MRAKICSGFLIMVLSIFGGGCEKKAGPGPKAGPVGDACDLITKEEVEAVQETKVSEAKSNAQPSGPYAVSLCYYATEAPNKSVSLALTKRAPDATDGNSPAVFWKSTFGRFEDEEEGDEEKKEGRERPRGGEEEGTPPKKISGLGDSAFWAGSRVGGALYVLKGDAFIRISVGGTDSDEARLEKSKRLAAKALARF
jgi:hypothetical protein